MKFLFRQFYFWHLGGLIGLVVTVGTYVMAIFLSRQGNPHDWQQLGLELYFMIGKLQALPVAFGRCFYLPIENSKERWFTYDTNWFGDLFVVIYWTVFGMLVGVVIDRIVDRWKRWRDLP